MSGEFDLEKMLKCLDASERAKLESAEFRANAEASFDKADVSKTGELSNEEEMLSAVLGALPPERQNHEWVNKHGLKELMLEFDKNKDGQIQKGEFVQFITWSIANEIHHYFEAAGTTAKAAAFKVPKGCFQELKAMAAPPVAVIDTCNCVAILTGDIDNEVEWDALKKFLADRALFDKLKKLQDIPADRVQKAKALIEAKGLELKAVRSKSAAAGGLFEWVDKCCK